MKTQTMLYVQSFPDDAGYHKIMVQSYDTGRRWFIWYWYSLGIEEGQDVLITFDNLDYWSKISNLVNGNESDIHSVLEVN